MPRFAAGGVQAEQDLEFGVGLVGLMGLQVALDQERPCVNQLGVESERLAASRDGPGPVPGLGADSGQSKAIIRAPGADLDRLFQRRARLIGPLEAPQRESRVREGPLATRLNGEYPFEC